MKILRSIMAAISAPLVYGVICVPLVGIVMSLSPELVNDQGGTYNVALTLQVEAVQLLMLLICGAVVSAIAPSRPMLHAMIATALMLAIGLSVQLSFWEAMLVWHHYVFLIGILACVPLGASLVQILRGGGAETNVTA